MSWNYFLLNVGLTHSIYIMIDWGRAAAVHSLCWGKEGGTQVQIPDSNPWSNPGAWSGFIYSKGESKHGERTEAWPCSTQACTPQINPHHIRDGRDWFWVWGLMHPGLSLTQCSADTRPGPTPLLWSGWPCPSLLHYGHWPSRLRDVTDVTLMVSPCWPDQCQCVTACKALYTCTAHMSVLSEFHPLSSGPHLDRDRSGVLATSSVHQTQATVICTVYTALVWRKWKKIKLYVKYT